MQVQTRANKDADPQVSCMCTELYKLCICQQRILNDLIDLPNDREVPLTVRTNTGCWGWAEFEA